MPADMQSHPLRARVLSELHARPFAPVETPKRLLHFAFMTDEAAATRDRAALTAFSESLGEPGPAAGAKHHRVAFSGAVLRWESHSEFTTYTWEFPGNPQGVPDLPFRPTPDAFVGAMDKLPQPGPLLVAVDLHLLPEGASPGGPEAVFGAVGLAASRVEGEAAVVASDFKSDPHGFVRILVLDRGLHPAQAGSLVQRLIEIETYRTLALLGLPEAQALAPAIRRIEVELPLLLEAMRDSHGFDDNKRLLLQLTELAADLEGGASATLFRFGATRAYHDLVLRRLEAIGEEPLPGLSTWESFLSRRMLPAIRTCAATEERQANLSRKVARAAQLLRTRVEIDLQSQNRGLLHAMNERARVQLRLQQTVEGLSVAAITYYVASLIHIVLEGAHEAGVAVDPTVGTAIAVPVVLVGIGYLVRRIRRSHDVEDTS